MSGIEVNIDGAAINAAVTKAVLDSVVGEQMKKALESVLTPNAYGRKSLVESAVEAAVHEQVRMFCREIVREPETADRIRAAIRAGLTDERLGEITSAFVAQLGLITTDDMR